MRKNRIRLTESQLHNVIKESVKNVLKEVSEPSFNRMNKVWKHYDEKSTPQSLDPRHPYYNTDWNEKVGKDFGSDKLPDYCKKYFDILNNNFEIFDLNDWDDYHGVLYEFMEQTGINRDFADTILGKYCEKYGINTPWNTYSDEEEDLNESIRRAIRKVLH